MAMREKFVAQPPPSSAATSRINTDTVQRAVNALLKWKNSQSKSQKPQLLGEDDFIYLILALKKIPPKDRTNAHKIPLRHPLHDSTSAAEFCLIIDDRSKSRLTSEEAKKKVKAEGIPISKVLKLSKLKTDYRPFEAKRKLCDSYDMFFADKRVIPLLPKLLGKQFFKKKKIPVPVDLGHKNWKEQIERTCSSALLYLRTGTCSAVKVGTSSMESGEIVENVVAAIDGVIEIVPKKWVGVRSFHLKFSESLALPVYQVLPDIKLKIEGAKRTVEGIEEEGGPGRINVKENKKDENLGERRVSNKKKNKGRIHEVRYMDSYMGGLDEDEFGSNDGNEDAEAADEDERENDDDDDDEGKKRKQKDVKASRKLKDGKKLKRLVAETVVGEESAGKKVKKKSGIAKLEDGMSQVKNKKSKRTLSA